MSRDLVRALFLDPRSRQSLERRHLRSLRSYVRQAVGDAPGDAADRQRARVGRNQRDPLFRQRPRRKRRNRSDR